MAADDAGDDVGEVGLGVHVVQLAGLDQRGEHGPVFGAAVGAGEEVVLAAEGERADGALDDVGVDLDAAVVEEPSEALPAAERVADRLRELALLAEGLKPGLQPRLQGLDEWAASRLPLVAPLVRWTAADVGLDLVERLDPLDGFHGDRRRAGGGQLVELAPHVRPAEGERHRVPAGELAIAGVAIDLQHAAEASEVLDRPFTGAVRGVDIGCARRVWS